MQAVFLLYDYGFCRNVNALLRAFGIAQLATDTFIRYKVTCFLCLRPAKRKAGAFDWLLGKVKPFARPLVNFEYGEGAAGAHIGINLLHIGIFAEQVGKFLRPDFFRLALHRYRHAGQGIFTLHSGKGDVLIAFQPVINVLAFGGQEIKAAVIIIHDVDGSGDGSPLTVHGGKYGGVDLLNNVLQIIIRLHNEPPNSVCPSRWE